MGQTKGARFFVDINNLTFFLLHPSSSSTLPSHPHSSCAVSSTFYRLFAVEIITMPPRTRAASNRPLFDLPIFMKILWCMHCLRTALAEWDNTMDWPFVIECVRDAKASVSCKQCSDRNSTCIPVGFANPFLSEMRLTILGFNRYVGRLLGPERLAGVGTEAVLVGVGRSQR
jgi:hypothetical protein